MATSFMESITPTSRDARVHLARATTGEEVADVLREQIMEGTLSSGAPLREVALADEFDVSRRTIQDALTVLVSDGLVRHERHRGARVAELTRADVTDIYAIRGWLETSAARCAATASDEAREHLRQAFEDLRIAMSVGSPHEIVSRDLAFHVAVVGLLESPRTDRFFRSVAIEMRYALSILESVLQESSRRPQEALEEHKDILDALLSGQVTHAQELINAHVKTNRDTLIDALRTEEPSVS